MIAAISSLLPRLPRYHPGMAESVIDEAHAFLRAHATGDLRFEENLRPIKYVIHPDGRLIAPVMVAMLRAFDHVLFVPEYAEGAMELQLTLEQFDERGPEGAAADRWRIYHGEPDDVRWAFMVIDAARYGEMVIDGQALMRPNPLAKVEGQICRTINQNHLDDLRQLCARFGSMEVEQPVMVGIDPLGIDVRARFDMVRVPSIRPMTSAEDALRVLQNMASGDGPRRPA